MREFVAIGAAALALSTASLAGGACAPEWDRSLGVPGASSPTGGSVFGALAWNGALYLGGGFDTFGGTPGTAFGAKFDGTNVLPIGDFDDGFINDFFVFNDGAGDDLYIGGAFSSVNNTTPGTRALVRYDGASLTSVGWPVGGASSVWSMTKWNGMLVAGGTGAGAGAAQRPSLGFWNGSTWTEIGEHFNGPIAPVILSVGTWHDGVSEKLYVGGRFTTYDADLLDPLNPVVTCANIMGFDGTNWFPLATGLTRSSGTITQVQALISFNDGTGSRLYVGGRFDRGSGNAVPGVAKWDGVSWQPVGDGFPLPTEVRDLEVFNDGTGPALYAVGTFTVSGAATTRRFAKWTGAQWVEVGGGLDNNASKLAVYRAPGDPAPGLFVGGSYLSVGNGAGPNAGPANAASIWTGCATCPGDANGDGVVNFGDLNIVLSNFGAAGAGVPGDVNGDGLVNFADLNIVLGAFGTVC